MADSVHTVAEQMDALWSGDRQAVGSWADAFLSSMTPLVDRRVRELGGGKRQLSDVTNRGSPLQPRTSGKKPLHRASPQPAERDPCVRRLDLGGSPALQVFQDENIPSGLSQPRDGSAAAPARGRGTASAADGRSDAALGRRSSSRLSLKRGRSLISGPPVRVQQQERPPLSPLVTFSVPEVQPAKRQNVDGVPTPTVAPLPPLDEEELEPPAQPQPSSSPFAAPPEQIDDHDAQAQPDAGGIAAAGPGPASDAATAAGIPPAAVSSHPPAAAQQHGDALPTPDASKVTVRRRRRLAARPPPSPALRRSTLDRRVSFASAHSATPAALPNRSQLSVTAYHSQ